MNEKLNLVEILKDCPKGTRLYSTIFGEVKFGFIDDNSVYPIALMVNGGYEYLTSEGKLYNQFDGECILFPSRENRDWSKFTAPWYKKEKKLVEHKFNDGDIVTICSGLQIFILQKAISGNLGYCYTGYDFKRNEFFVPGRWAFNRLATEDEKKKLFQAIKDNGYKWNAETKTLDKLVKPRFDPKTLMAFDKVLVRLRKDYIWHATFFSHYDKEVKWGCCPFVTTCSISYSECIPYNDETKHLLGTSEEAPEYYRYWED